ncbi:TatD deoxyribonuclease-like protein [Encephalitozoon intestinalis ATCC 50506]|uniref:TatD deoxyribonuclease-like protein n=1 Tax=Encephalitozoon intestinalis (strain ATCC 50506) TaxID=876142 RepID=E0S620_ENCIT|nr:TatD deoxyribonuclease-like protein [Encephalitozoon intestinalis ATCC 50506]ADM11155.1 TatD deoxyribonuclease-like protein [Encephalitozoon intestinalis ATCC 50506]UTX44820.1 TatD deoxyribonuclease [Encephalitozoon intestinalis]
MFIDIAVNITDKLLARDESSVEEVIRRCKDSKVLPIFIGLDHQTSQTSINLARKYKTISTVGIHPTSSSKYKNIDEIIPLIEEDAVVAIGECGLDYDRLEFADKISQKRIFRSQLDLEGDCYFLHSRSCHRDFMEIVSDYRLRGVVHSFTGSIEEAEELIKKGFFIGINGCSAKTSEGIDVIKNLPLDSLLIETDSPYCKIRKSYAGFEYVTTDFSSLKVLKKKNEPCCVVQVAEIISNATEKDFNLVVETVFSNTIKLYGDVVRKSAEEWGFLTH